MSDINKLVYEATTPATTPSFKDKVKGKVIDLGHWAGVGTHPTTNLPMKDQRQLDRTSFIHNKHVEKAAKQAWKNADMTEKDALKLKYDDATKNRQKAAKAFKKSGGNRLLRLGSVGAGILGTGILAHKALASGDPDESVADAAEKVSKFTTSATGGGGDGIGSGGSTSYVNNTLQNAANQGEKTLPTRQPQVIKQGTGALKTLGIAGAGAGAGYWAGKQARDQKEQSKLPQLLGNMSHLRKK